MFAHISNDVKTVLQSTSVTDIAMRRIYRLVDMGELEIWRTLEKTSRICTKWYRAIPNGVSEVGATNVRRDYVPAYAKVPSDRSRGGSQTMNTLGTET